MNARADYHELAERIDYAKLDRKLDNLREQEPPKTRKGVAELLAPVREKLLDLHAKGWTYKQLGQELEESGLPVKVATLRNYLSSRAHGGRRSARGRGRKRVAVGGR